MLPSASKFQNKIRKVGQGHVPRLVTWALAKNHPICINITTKLIENLDYYVAHKMFGNILVWICFLLFFVGFPEILWWLHWTLKPWWNFIAWLSDRALKSGNNVILVNRINRVVKFGGSDTSISNDRCNEEDEDVFNHSIIKNRWEELTITVKMLKKKTFSTISYILIYIST